MASRGSARASHASVSAEISQAAIQQYDCEVGGDPVLDLVISGNPARVFEALECAKPEASAGWTS